MSWFKRKNITERPDPVWRGEVRQFEGSMKDFEEVILYKDDVPDIVGYRVAGTTTNLLLRSMVKKRRFIGAGGFEYTSRPWTVSRFALLVTPTGEMLAEQIVGWNGGEDEWSWSTRAYEEQSPQTVTLDFLNSNLRSVNRELEPVKTLGYP